MKINTISIAKEAFKDKKLVVKELKKNKVKINYLAKRGNYNRKPFIFSREIEVDEKFIEGIGLFLGDGDVHRKDKSHTIFSSKDKDIAKHYLEFIRKYFLINNKDITLLINYRKKNKNIKNEWGKILKFKKEKILIRYSNRHREESCSIQINGVIFRKIFDLVLKNLSNTKILYNKVLRRAFLRGIFAAEGGLGIQYLEGKPYIDCISFSISTKEIELRDLICKALDLEKISWHVYIDESRHSLAIKVTNWQNYLKLWRINIFRICDRKNIKFVMIAKNLAIYLRFNSRFRCRFFDSLNMHQWEIAKIIDSWQANVSRTIDGVHLLRIEQIMNLLEYSHFNINNVFDNIKEVRIGSLTVFEPKTNVLQFIKEFKLL